MRRGLLILFGLPLFGWSVYSLYVVARFGGAVILDPQTTSRIMGVRNGETLYSAKGLTYHGIGGAALVIAELVLVAGALAGVGFRRGHWRLASSTILMAWAALWFANALMLQSAGWDRPRDVVLLGAVMVVATFFTGLCALGTRTRPEAPATA